MKVSLNWINTYTDLPLDNAEQLNTIVDKIALQIVDVDERWMQESKRVIDVDNKIITNRSYAFGHRGFAREVAVMLGQEWRGGIYPSLPKKTADLPFSVNVEAPDLCPRYTAIVLKGVKLNPSPDYLKTALEKVGMRSINSIVDITNYIMLDTAQPVHAFDYHKLTGHVINARRAKVGETVITLDGIKRFLTNNSLIITDAEKPVGIGGIMGAENSEIDEDTKDIVLVVESFHPINIRQEGRALKLRTEAGTRFEKGPDPSNIPNVMALLVNMIMEHCGGEVASDFIDINNLAHSTVRYEPVEMKLAPNRITKLLGYEIDPQKITSILNGFGISIKTKNQDEWIVEVPSYRSDIKFTADIIEDIGRMYGYEHIPNRPPVNHLVIPQENKKIEAYKKLRTALTASGLDEVITYPFISEADKELFSIKKLIPIINPQSNDYKYLRNSLVPSLIKVVGHNAKYFDKFGIFELARTFLRSEEDKDHEETVTQQPVEKEVLSIMFYDSKNNEQSIFSIKGDVENLMDMLHISNYLVKSEGTITINKEPCGKIDFVSNKVLHSYDIACPVPYAEISLEVLLKNYVNVVPYKPFSRFQGTKLEFSIFVPPTMAISEIVDAIPPTELILNKEVTDIYKNIKDTSNKKSVSLCFFIQKKDENITANEIYDIGVWIESKLKTLKDVEIRGGGVKKPANYTPSTLTF